MRLAREGATEKSASGEAFSERPTLTQRRTDGLVLMAETLLEHGARPSSSADRYQVVIHASAEAFGLTKNQDDKLIFSRPDGRLIDNQPLPSAGSPADLRKKRIG